MSCFNSEGGAIKCSLLLRVLQIIPCYFLRPKPTGVLEAIMKSLKCLQGDKTFAETLQTELWHLEKYILETRTWPMFVFCSKSLFCFFFCNFGYSIEMFKIFFSIFIGKVIQPCVSIQKFVTFEMLIQIQHMYMCSSPCLICRLEIRRRRLMYLLKFLDFRLLVYIGLRFLGILAF